MILRRAQPEEFAAVGELTLAAYVADGYLEHDHELRGRAARRGPSGC